MGSKIKKNFFVGAIILGIALTVNAFAKATTKIYEGVLPSNLADNAVNRAFYTWLIKNGFIRDSQSVALKKEIVKQVYDRLIQESPNQTNLVKNWQNFKSSLNLTSWVTLNGRSMLSVS